MQRALWAQLWRRPQLPPSHLRAREETVGLWLYGLYQPGWGVFASNSVERFLGILHAHERW